MSYLIWDPDEYENVATMNPCHCGGNSLSGTCRTPGGCTASMNVGQRRRSPEEIAKIKAKKRRIHEESVLAEAAAILATRYQG